MTMYGVAPTRSCASEVLLSWSCSVAVAMEPLLALRDALASKKEMKLVGDVLHIGAAHFPRKTKTAIRYVARTARASVALCRGRSRLCVAVAVAIAVTVAVCRTKKGFAELDALWMIALHSASPQAAYVTACTPLKITVHHSTALPTASSPTPITPPYHRYDSHAIPRTASPARVTRDS